MIDLDLLGDLLSECRECLDRAEDQILAIQRENRVSRESLHALFRELHSVKGNAAFFGLSHLVRSAHAAENLLGLLRDSPRVRLADLGRVLPAIDALRTMLDQVEKEQNDESSAELADRTVAVLQERVRTLEKAQAQSEMSAADAPAREAIDEDFGFFDELPAAPAEPSSSAGTTALSATTRSTDEQEGGDKSAAATTAASTTASRDIRVPTARLEALLDLVGELVIAESMVLRQVQENELDPERLRKTVAQLDRIVRNVQETTLAMRMTPLQGVFRRVARMIQELAPRAGKQVRFIPSGEDTEIDKTLTEAVADPLIHLVRNAIDHGIEAPAERIAAGKSESGVIQMIARHLGGEIQIIIQDDGRGLSYDRIVNKARRSGLLAADQTISEAEAWDLIFLPGFSTAEQVTDLSGRGVGMDVVRKNLARLRGRIDVRSEAGVGSSFSIRVPLTLAIIDGLVFRAEGRLWVLPTPEVQRTQATEGAAVFRIQRDREVIRSEDRLIPVIHLNDFFQQGAARVAREPGPLIMFVKQSLRSVGIYVDEILGSQQIVIKALPDRLRNIRGLAGCTILGTGAVGLILDSHEILGDFSAGGVPGGEARADA